MNEIISEFDEADAEAKRKELAEAGIVFVDAVDFMKQELPPPEWIIPDFIAKRMKGDLYGKSKTFKTFLALQLAHCVATGSRFMCWDVPKPCNVVYFNLELIPWFAQERMSAQQGELHISLERGRLHICNLRGKARELREHADAIADVLARMKCDLAIIDPRYKLEKDGEDTNTADGLRGILDFRDTLANVCAVLMVGHDPKGDVAGKAIQDRGAGSFTAGADYDFLLAISPHKNDGYIVLSCGSRYRAAPPDMSLLWQPSAECFEYVEGLPAEVPTPSKFGRGVGRVFTKDGRRDLARRAAEIVRAHSKVCTKTDLVNEVYTAFHESDGVTRKTAEAVVQAMLGNAADCQDLAGELGIVCFERRYPKGTFVGTAAQLEVFKREEEKREAEKRGE